VTGLAVPTESGIQKSVAIPAHQCRDLHYSISGYQTAGRVGVQMLNLGQPRLPVVPGSAVGSVDTGFH
jgi:hypothetical protein